MIHKKRKKNASFGFFGHIQGQFRPFLACFGRIGRRPIRPNMADTARLWPNQPSSAQIDPHRCELSWVDANPRKKKKKPQTRSNAQATASDAGAAPLVPRPCFLGGNRLTMVFMGCNKVILMLNSFVLCIEYKLDFLAEAWNWWYINFLSISF